MVSVETFADSVRTLKYDLRKLISDRLVAFDQETGMLPASIDVSILEITSHEDRLKRYCVGDVRVGFGDY